MADRFTLLERLGQGSMGAVWKAVDNQTGDKVALKTIHSFYAEDAEYRARFEREVDIARRIQSPYVVKVFGYGQQDGLPYIAMEYVEGRSLRDLIRERGKLTWDQARTIFEQVAAGLDAAHRVGVVHRDLKPSNILLSDAGTAKLADFGISRVGDLTALTSSNAMLGTAAYMAPEDGSSFQSDIYALGCVLYEMLAGKPPFLGDSHLDLIRKHMRDDPDLTVIPDPPRQLVAAMLQKDPSLRPDSVAALIAGSDPTNQRSLDENLSSGHSRATRVAALLSLLTIVVGFSPFLGFAGFALAKLSRQLPSIPSEVDDDGYIWFADA